jgi:hypothetical protein
MFYMDPKSPGQNLGILKAPNLQKSYYIDEMS